MPENCQATAKAGCIGGVDSRQRQDKPMPPLVAADVVRGIVGYRAASGLRGKGGAEGGQLGGGHFDQMLITRIGR